MTEFTSTCEKPYDRHEYVITFVDGSKQQFEDYEVMRSFWFQHCRFRKMSVAVIDPKKKTKGFK